MKRFALAAAAALLGTGCISSTNTTYVPPPTTGSVDFAWSFIRYDAAGAPLATYTCALAGVDNVIVSFQLDGDVQVPCADNAGDGALVAGIRPGTQSVYVTGRRGSHALFQSQPLTVTVAVGQTTQAGSVNALGIADNLAVYANFLSRTGTDVGWSTCALAGVSTLDYVIADWANTVVASGTVSCTDPAGISFLGGGALDRDQYVIRMRGFPAGSAVETFDSATTVVAPTCDGQAFDHYGQLATDAWDVSLFDVHLNSTVCP